MHDITPSSLSKISGLGSSGPLRSIIEPYTRAATNLFLVQQFVDLQYAGNQLGFSETRYHEIIFLGVFGMRGVQTALVSSKFNLGCRKCYLGTSHRGLIIYSMRVNRTI